MELTSELEKAVRFNIVFCQNASCLEHIGSYTRKIVLEPFAKEAPPETWNYKVGWQVFFTELYPNLDAIYQFAARQIGS